MKSAESADCPNTSSTRAPWQSFIVKRPAAISSIELFQSRIPNILSLASTIVEMESVFALKARIGEIDQQAVLVPRRRLEADLARRRLLVAAVNDEHFRGARQLLVKHGSVEALRTLDALQLSVSGSSEPVTVFVAADQKLCRVATLEGFAVTNPEQPASIVT